jgi:hypothetical protein
VLTLGEELTSLVDRWRRFLLPFFKKFFPRVQHSGKTLFPERRSQLRHSGKKPSSPSAAAQALGEATLKILFFVF